MTRSYLGDNKILKLFHGTWRRLHVRRERWMDKLSLKQRHLCPIRDESFHKYTDHDYWFTWGRDRTCSYCGSWHTDEFILFCEEIVVTGGRHGTISLADGGSKVYIQRPHVHNSDDGALKFRLRHLPTGPDGNYMHLDIINVALKISNEIWMEKSGFKRDHADTESKKWLERWRQRQREG